MICDCVPHMEEVIGCIEQYHGFSQMAYQCRIWLCCSSYGGDNWEYIVVSTHIMIAHAETPSTTFFFYQKIITIVKESEVPF